METYMMQINFKTFPHIREFYWLFCVSLTEMFALDFLEPKRPDLLKFLAIFSSFKYFMSF